MQNEIDINEIPDLDVAVGIRDGGIKGPVLDVVGINIMLIVTDVVLAMG